MNLKFGYKSNQNFSVDSVNFIIQSRQEASMMQTFFIACLVLILVQFGENQVTFPDQTFRPRKSLENILKEPRIHDF